MAASAKTMAARAKNIGLAADRPKRLVPGGPKTKMVTMNGMMGFGAGEKIYIYRANSIELNQRGIKLPKQLYLDNR